MFGKNEVINIDNAIYMSSLNRDFLYIDSSSSDGTQFLLNKNKINFINHTYVNWQDLREEGYSYASQNNFEWILMLDADKPPAYLNLSVLLPYDIASSSLTALALLG